MCINVTSREYTIRLKTPSWLYFRKVACRRMKTSLYEVNIFIACWLDTGTKNKF